MVLLIYIKKIAKIIFKIIIIFDTINISKGDSMNKFIAMLKCYKNVMLNDKDEIAKIIPDMYCKSFYDIDEKHLLSKGIKNLIIDIDGTILPADSINVSEKLIRRIEELKKKKMNMCLVSNNGNARVLPVSQVLGLKYLCKAKKPLPVAFSKAMELLDASNKDEVAMIGDQMLSDIKGAHEYGLYTVLVRPISEHQNIQTGTSRILQNKMEKHLKKINMFDKNKFYNN